MKKLLVFFFIYGVSTQENREDLIRTIFNTTDFLDNYEEVTQPPLKSIGALKKCGQTDQKFVCVPYYNCNPDTNTVEENPDLDGTNKINIR